MIILAIDPGVRECAYARAAEDRLVWVGLLPAGAVLPFRPALVIVERPDYQGARSDAARTQDLLALSWAGARAAYSIGAPVEEYTPREWKGSEAKPPQHLRMWEDTLSDDERKLFPPGTGKLIMKAAEKYALRPQPGAACYGRGRGSEVHNLLDAAAFLLAYVGRFR